MRETLLQQYGIKELTDNYISIFGRYNVAEDGTIILDEPNKEQSTNSEKELVFIDKHKDTPTITPEKQSVRKDTDVINGRETENESPNNTGENSNKEIVAEDGTPVDLVEIGNSINKSSQIEKEVEPEKILLESNQTNELLVDLYRDSENFAINEQRIVDLHSQFVNSREWSNISQCIASIAYVLIRQIEFANRPNGLKFKKLKNLYRKCIVIYNQDNLVFKDGNHLHNIGIVEEKLIQRYKYLLTVFFKEIIGSYNVATDGTIIFEEEEQEENTSVQNDTEDDSNDNNNSDGNVEKEEDDKMPQEPTTDIPEFDSNASYNEEGTNILLAKIEAYSNNSSIVEIFQYYFLDIQESFFHVKTKGELFEAYQHFKEYTAINFISKTHKEELMEAFRCYIYYLLEINKK